MGSHEASSLNYEVDAWLARPRRTIQSRKIDHHLHNLVDTVIFLRLRPFDAEDPLVTWLEQSTTWVYGCAFAAASSRAIVCSS